MLDAWKRALRVSTAFLFLSAVHSLSVAQSLPAPTVQMPLEVKRAAEAFDSATRLQKAGKIPQAIAAYQSFFRLAQAAKLPQASQLPALYNLSLLYRQQGNPKGLAETLRKAVAIDSKNMGVLAELATAEASLGRFDAAKKAAQTVLASKPSPLIEAPAHFALGLVALNANDFPIAEKEFSATIRLAPKNPQAHLNLAIALARQKRIAPALTAAETAKKLDPNLLQAYLFAASLYREGGNLPAAIASYDGALRLQPKMAEVQFDRALLLQKMGRVPESLAGYLKVVELAPNNPSARLNAGQLYYAIENYRAAQQQYLEAAKLTPKDPRPYIGIGLCELQEAAKQAVPKARIGGFQRAEAALNRALALDPKNTLAEDSLTYLYERSLRFDDARKRVEKCLETEPDSLKHYQSLARIGMALRDANTVVGVWKRYRERKPLEMVSYAEAASILELSSKPEEALKEWEAYLRLMPKDGNGLLQTGRILILLKQTDEAKRRFLTALALDFGSQKTPGEMATAEAIRMEAMRGLATIASEAKLFGEAVNWLKQEKDIAIAQSRRTRSAPAGGVFRALARAYGDMKQPALAAKEYQELAFAYPNEPQIYVDMAKLYEEAGNTVEAARAYRQAAYRDPDPLVHYLSLGTLYRRQSKVAQEIAEYEKIRDKHGKDARFLEALASAYELMEQDTKALEVYRQLANSPRKSVSAMGRMASVLLRLKRYAEVRALHEATLNVRPDNSQTYADLLQVYVLENRRADYLAWLMKRWERRPLDETLATTLYEEMERQKGVESALAFFDAYRKRNAMKREAESLFARLMMKYRRFEPALEVYRQLSERYPKEIEVQNDYIAALDLAGKPEEALKALEKQANRTDLMGEMRLGFRRQLAERYYRLEKNELAIPLYQEVVKAQKDDFQAVAILADLLRKTGREEELLPIYANILTLKAYPPGIHAEMHRRMAAILEKQSRKTDAIGHYREALKIDTNDTVSQAALKRLGVE